MEVILSLQYSIYTNTSASLMIAISYGRKKNSIVKVEYDNIYPIYLIGFFQDENVVPVLHLNNI